MDFRFISLSSPRLLINSFSPDDARESFAVQSAKLTRFMGWEPSPSSEAFAEVWRHWSVSAAEGREAFLTIRLAATREYLGMVGLHDIEADAPEIGVWIKETEHGHGYGREAVETIMAFGARSCAKSAFTYPVAEQNIASRRLAESLGGVLVGRRNLRKASGVEIPEVVYRIASMEPLNEH